VAAVAKDGIQVIAIARVTVRANIERLVGGAGEETIIARVGEGTVSSIGSAISHKSVLENPDAISKLVLSRGLDAGTAYEILSIDIADVDVGRNIGADLQIAQAEANKRIAQADAEKRRAMAVAHEQEMRARVVEAEAQVPQAIAESFRSGNLGIMDYYRMRNVQADTEMRESLAQDGVDGADPVGRGVEEDVGIDPRPPAARLEPLAVQRREPGEHREAHAQARVAGAAERGEGVPRGVHVRDVIRERGPPGRHAARGGGRAGRGRIGEARFGRAAGTGRIGEGRTGRPGMHQQRRAALLQHRQERAAALESLRAAQRVRGQARAHEPAVERGGERRGVGIGHAGGRPGAELPR
jgi:hypothetical protein